MNCGATPRRAAEARTFDFTIWRVATANRQVLKGPATEVTGTRPDRETEPPGSRTEHEGGRAEGASRLGLSFVFFVIVVVRSRRQGTPV